MTHISPAHAVGPVAASPAGRYSFAPAARGDVELSPSGFLGGWQRLNADATIPHCIAEVEKSGAVDNFRRLVGESDSPFRGWLFADSDVYKLLEAIAWEVGRSGTDRFNGFVDDTVRLLSAAQRPDGYLNSWVQGHDDKQPLTELRWSHELYCLGHLIQAAIAWSRATNRGDLLAIAMRYADFVNRELGPTGREAVDGHPEVETALVELSRATGRPEYLELAIRFIDLRGHRTVGEDGLGYAYFQDHEPMREAQEVAGHAVRQLYLAAGAADVVIERDDPALEAALERLWRSAHEQKMYLTGGMGSRHTGEAFGDPYELPSDRAYAETCAAIADFQWGWRMLLRTGESRFADAMERVLYNAIAAGESASGTEFFYSTPLHRRESHHPEANAPTRRQSWYGCACCPPNLARLAASLDSYLLTRADGRVWVHFYSDAELTVGEGADAATATMRTEYPWDGRVTIDFDREPAVELHLRLPAWADEVVVRLDGRRATASTEKGYLVINRGAVHGRIELEFAMPARAVRPHPRVDALRGSVAVVRGPIVYCLEQNDLPGEIDPDDARIGLDAQFELAPGPDGLDTPALLVTGLYAATDAAAPLYTSQLIDSAPTRLGAVPLIPYFRWGNRRKPAMRVWIPQL